MNSITAREVGIRLLITLLSTVITVIVFEVTLRLSNYLPEYFLKLKTLSDSRGLLHIVLDPEVLYRVKPNSSSEINELGYREPPIGMRKEGVQRVAVLGDSFIMGNNVAPDKTAPKLAEKTLGERYRVFNLGISGYGPDQSLIRFQREKDIIDPDFLVVSIFAGNDLRDVEINHLFELKNDSEVVQSHSNIVADNLPPFRLEMLLRVLFQSHYLRPGVEEAIQAQLIQDETDFLDQIPEKEADLRLSILHHVVLEYMRWSKASGKPVLFLILPSYETVAGEKGGGINERAISKVLSDEDSLFLDLTEAFKGEGVARTFDSAYRHPNETGNGVIAREIATIIQRKG